MVRGEEDPHIKEAPGGCGASQAATGSRNPATRRARKAFWNLQGKWERRVILGFDNNYRQWYFGRGRLRLLAGW